MSGMHYRRHSRNQKDDWEKRRLAAVKRLNKSNKGGQTNSATTMDIAILHAGMASVSGGYNHCNMQ